jgi:hypothetical protein
MRRESTVQDRNAYTFGEPHRYAHLLPVPEPKPGSISRPGSARRCPASEKNRQFRKKGHEPAPSYFKNGGAARQLKATSFAAERPQPEIEPYPRPRPKIMGLDHDLNDEIPF